MFENLLSDFTTSSHGQQAMAALSKNGFSAQDAENIVSEALPAAKATMEGQVANHPHPEVGLFNIFGGHAGKSFLIGLTEGIVRGDGIGGSIEDAGISVIAGHIGDVIADRLNLSSDLAALGAAVVAPFIVRFAHEKLAASN